MLTKSASITLFNIEETLNEKRTGLYYILFLWENLYQNKKNQMYVLQIKRIYKASIIFS